MIEKNSPWMTFQYVKGVQKEMSSYRWPRKFKRALAAQAKEESKKYGYKVTATDILYTLALEYKPLALKETKYADKKEKHRAPHQPNQSESQSSNT